MKKFMFSAFALVAFSFAGMANEVEEKESVILNDDCNHCYEYADSLDDGRDRTNQTWMRNVDACRTSNGCKAEFSKLIKKQEY